MADEGARKTKTKKRYTARLDGNLLALSHDPRLPPVCMKCGARDGIVRRDVVFTWAPVWVRYLVFCGIGLFLRLLMQVRASLVVPLCASCNKRWAAARYATFACVGLLMAAMITARFLGVRSELGRDLVLGAFALLVLVRFLFVRPRVLQVHHLDENAITFKNANEEAVKEIVEGAQT